MIASIILAVVGIVGAAVTLALCVRLLMAVRRGEGRDSVVGWFALLFVPALVVFALSLLLGRLSTGS